jgi:hypothetical protein
MIYKWLKFTYIFHYSQLVPLRNLSVSHSELTGDIEDYSHKAVLLEYTFILTQKPPTLKLKFILIKK